MEKPIILVIVGPTAVGKTETALRIATELDCEIISADSMQIYRGMNIGTAKASTTDQALVKHHLIDIIEPDTKFTVADYVKLATESITNIQAQGKLPLITGGTGLYINALIDGFLFPDQGENKELRQKLYQVAKEDPEKLYRQLEAVDPSTAAKIHVNDHRRVVRALEVYHTRGQPISKLQAKQKIESNYRPIIIGLNRDRALLYERINQRVDFMIEQNLVSEVESLLNAYPHQPTALQGIGYKEIADYLRGEISLEEAISIIKRETRRYAKRQLSWFRRDKRIHWFDLEHVTIEEIVTETKLLLAKATN